VVLKSEKYEEKKDSELQFFSTYRSLAAPSFGAGNESGYSFVFVGKYVSESYSTDSSYRNYK
jgi:hypothetical protein